jgi:hypothetical protein
MRLRLDAGQALSPTEATQPRACPKRFQLYKALLWRHTSHIQVAHYKTIRKVSRYIGTTQGIVS